MRVACGLHCHKYMRLVLRLSFLLLIATSFALIGCGEFDKIFVMDNGKSTEENKLSSSELSSLQLEDDTESVVISNLNTLKDSDFDIEKDQKSIGTTLSYISRVLKRSELLPKEKRSQLESVFSTTEKTFDFDFILGHNGLNYVTTNQHYRSPFQEYSHR